MKKDNEKRLMIIFGVLGEVLIIWLSLLIAPTLGGGLPQMLPKLADAFANPFSFSWSEKTIPCILLLSMIYGFSLLVWHYTKPNYRRREEHGSAKWGNVKAVDKKYRQEPMENNRILTQNLSIGYNSREHRRNLNTLIVGGSGSGKTFHYAKPNLLMANTSFLIRGERPVMDVKYDILGHQNIALSAIGGGEVYRHGKERLAACGITVVNLADYPGKQMKDFPLMESVVEDIEAYDQDELEIYINLKEQQENEKKK